MLNMIVNRKRLFLICVLLILACFAGCNAPGRDYADEKDVLKDSVPVGESVADRIQDGRIGSEPMRVEKGGSYSNRDEVAEYIHVFGTLPQNYITKKEAEAAGWNKSEGNLWSVAEGKSIGGDYFGNREGLLPDADGRIYYECDVNYSGGYRGPERIVFSNDGLIFYTPDHYESFEQLYWEVEE